jgi:hypothetical protein
MKRAPAGVNLGAMHASLSSFIASAALGVLEGALVALPGPAALGRLERLRSPAWALVLPGMLIVGTFSVLALPGAATALAVLAAVATPVLAAIAIVAVVHGRRPRLLLVPVGLAFAAVLSGWPGELAASLLTALGCVTLGAVVVRLTPARWLAFGVLTMCAVDVLLIASGVGVPAAALLENALVGSGLPTLHHARLGPVTTDYPDLMLAAVLGSVFAGRAIQRRGALLVAALSAAYAALLTIADILPATVPLALALVLLEWGPRLPRLTRTPQSTVRWRAEPAPDAT